MEKKIHYFMAFLAYFVWGMTFPFSKLVIPPLSSIMFVFFRSIMGFSFLFLVIMFSKQVKPWINAFKENWWQFALLALIPYCFSYVLQFHAIQFTTAINQSITAQTSILWVVVMNFIFFKQKPSLKFLIAVFVAIFGVFLLITNQGFQFSPETIKGDLLSLAAFISWASYSTFSKPFSENTNPLFVITSVFLFGFIYLLPIAIWQKGFIQIHDFDGFQWGIFLYLGIICTGLAYWLHMKSMAHPDIKSEHIVYFGLLMPIVSTVFSLITSDEELTWRIVFGGILVLLSVVIVLTKPKKPKNHELFEEDYG